MREWLQTRAQRVARSPSWRVGRFVLAVFAFLLAWTGLTGPELLKEFGFEFVYSDSFRTVLVVAGLAVVIAILLVPAPFDPDEWTVNYRGQLVPLRRSVEGYKAACEWAESKWWLRLERPGEDDAEFVVTVRHETGQATHDRFFQGGNHIVVWYPDHFETAGMPIAKPWGEYEVTWDVILPTGEHEVVTREFVWSPFMLPSTAES